MIYRLPMSALPRVTFRRSSAVERCKIVSLVGTTGTPRRISGDNYDSYLNLLRNTHLWAQDNLQSTPGGKLTLKEIDQPISAASNNDNTTIEGMTPAAAAKVELKENTDAMRFQVEMPGVDKKTVNVYLEGTFLVVKGVREHDPEFEDDDEEDYTKIYSAKLNLWPLHTYKIEGIKAELKNGILKVIIPKVKHEERTDVLHVQVN
ncbi:hypothetical protein RND81_06G229700 [Saponaria officinalis]|uniref:SHSP domain-containing protein n=1 Tax=Saponaria officinalis TaxID=3572 RepID=A0AAW1KDL6_SAPOF